MYELTDKIIAGSDILAEADAFDEDDRKAYMNASEAASCLRKQWYMKFTEVPQQDWGYARRGHGIEAWVVERAIAGGVDLRLAGKDQETIYSDKHRISATPDGVIVTNEGLWGVEFKSIDPRTNRGNLPKKGQTEQLQCGMALIDLIKEDVGLPELPYLGGFLHYTDASNWHDQFQLPVPFKPDILDQLKPRADRLFKAKSADSLPREGKLAGGQECRLCPFSGPCGVTGAGNEDAEAKSKRTRIGKAVQEYLDGKAQEDLGKKLKADAAERIKTAMKRAGKKIDEVDGHTVTLSEVAGRTTLDRKALEADGIDLSPYEKQGAPSERLVVK